jgi:hypothetical protein
VAFATLPEHILDDVRVPSENPQTQMRVAVVPLLGFFVQINSHRSHTPLLMSNFGCDHGSQRSLSNLPLVTARPKLPERRKKAKISVGFVEILLV